MSTSTPRRHAHYGDAKAKVLLVEFSDYQCPYCGRYANDTFSKLIDGYVKTGKVRYVLRNFPIQQLHPLAKRKPRKQRNAPAIRASTGKCTNVYLKNQQLLDVKQLPGHAMVLGLDQADFQQCIDSGKFTAKVMADFADGTKLKVSGTPFLLRISRRARSQQTQGGKTIERRTAFKHVHRYSGGIAEPFKKRSCCAVGWLQNRNGNALAG